jgi:hypothetical protein
VCTIVGSHTVDREVAVIAAETSLICSKLDPLRPKTIRPSAPKQQTHTVNTRRLVGSQWHTRTVAVHNTQRRFLSTLARLTGDARRRYIAVGVIDATGNAALSLKLHYVLCVSCRAYPAVQCAMCNVQCAMCNVQCAMCNMQCAMCNVMCNVQCAMCNVQCALSPVKNGCRIAGNCRMLRTYTNFPACCAPVTDFPVSRYQCTFCFHAPPRANPSTTHMVSHNAHGISQRTWYLTTHMVSHNAHGISQRT